MVSGDADHGTAGRGSGVRHDSFTISRHLAASPARVFAAFADPAIRRRWFKLPGTGTSYQHDFQVGGGETARSTFTMPESAPERLEYRSRYIDIATPQRIVYAYQTVVDDVLRWTALVTVELYAESAGTHLDWTEQAAFLAYTGNGDADLAHLRGGTGLRLNGLDAALKPPGSQGQRPQSFLRRQQQRQKCAWRGGSKPRSRPVSDPR